MVKRNRIPFSLFVWPWFWRYMLADCRGWRHFWCRLRNHPDGPIFYNPGGTEPDWHCINCDEYLG